MSDLTQRLRKRGDVFMPEWAHKSSGYWYDYGGRERRDDARLLREAADRIDELEAKILERTQWSPLPSGILDGV